MHRRLPRARAVRRPRFHRGAPAALMVVALLAAGALGGCGNPVRASAGANASPLTGVNWAAGTYPSDCFTPGSTAQVQVRHYVATGPDGFLQMKVHPPVYGTVDGTPVAVLTYRCIGANAGPDTALVYTWTGGGPHLSATLLSGADVYVQRISVSAGAIRLSGLGYRPGTPQCCPDLDVTYTYRWSGGRPVPAGHTATPLPTQQPTRSA